MLLVLFIIINLIGGVIGYLSATGNLHDARRKFLSRPKAKGWAVLMLTLIWIFLVGLHSKLTSNIEDERNALATERAEQNTNKIIRELLQYGLRYDSGQQKIINVLRDSLKTPSSVTIINGNKPDLDFCVDCISVQKITSDSLILSLQFCSLGSSSYHVNIKSKILLKIAGVEVTQPFEFQGDFSDIKIPFGAAAGQSVHISLNGQELEGLYALAIGDFKDTDGKINHFKTLLRYDFKNNKCSIPNQFDSNLDLVKKRFGL